MGSVIKVENVGVKFTKYGNIKRQELKRLVLHTLKGKKIKKEDFWALRNVSFSFEQGEIIGIIGSNGAGKSTLCRVLSHIFYPDEGEVEVNGLVSALLSLGTGFNNELTGKENVYLNAMMLGFSLEDVEQVYDNIVEFADIGEFINQPIKQYSKGMKSRLGFSIAAMLEPEILILDETLNAGDEKFKKKASQKMAQLMEHSKLVILVSHDLAFIEERCSRVLWLEKGKLISEGSPSEMIDRYRNSVKPRKKTKKILENYVPTQISKTDIDVVSIDGVSLKYKVNKSDFLALKDVSFTVRQGEILGIIGHNGAGKTTLCKILGSIIKPDSGSIYVGGKTTEILGFGSGFNRELTGLDNIYLNGLLLGIPKKELHSLVDEIIDFSGLGNSINDTLREYSSGMIARLGFSIATSIDPEILIIDEALSAGDYAFQEKAANKLQSLIYKAKAVIVVTHNMNFVRNVCTQAMWMERGMIKLTGEPTLVVNSYIKR